MDLNMINHLALNKPPSPANGSSSAAILRALSDHSREGLLVVDSESRTVVEANVPLGELFDLDPSRLIHSSAEQAGQALGRNLDDSEAFEERFNHFLEFPEATGRFELVLQTARKPAVIAYVTPIRDEHGEVTAKLWSFHDASVQRALEKGLREAQQLETSARLAAGIVHDSNNLLTLVLGQLGLALEDFHELPCLTATIEPAMTAAEKCAKLLKTVLKLAREQGGQLEVVQGEHVLREVETLVRAATPASVSIRTRYEEHLPPILANPVQLHQVVMNLALNSIDAMPNGGELEFTLSQRDGDVCLAVTDNGQGMPPDVKDRIFDPFFTTKGQENGTGLGLDMVANIVREHGGTIRCDSLEGKGTTFEICFPAATPAVPASSQPEAVAS